MQNNGSILTEENEETTAHHDHLLGLVIGCVGRKNQMTIKTKIVTASFIVLVLVGIEGIYIAWSHHSDKIQREQCFSNMIQIYSSVWSGALEFRLSDGDHLPMSNVVQYMKGGRIPDCPRDGHYIIPLVGSYPSCSIHGAVTATTWGENLEWVPVETD